MSLHPSRAVACTRLALIKEGLPGFSDCTWAKAPHFKAIHAGFVTMPPALPAHQHAERLGERRIDQIAWVC
jgi:hypothetical protein